VKEETQACRLAQMMQKQQRIPSYELVLPFVNLATKEYADLAVNDIFLLGLENLDLALLKEDVFCATVQVYEEENGHYLHIEELKEKPIKPSDSKKYEILKLSFGFVQCSVLDTDSKIAVKQIDFKKVSLILNHKKRAEASLILVDGKIALTIEKVEK